MPGSTHTAWTDALVERVKLYANEMSVPTKYSNDRILEVSDMVAPEIMTDLMAAAQNKPTVIWRLVGVAGVMDYALPPYFGNLVNIGTYDSNTGSFLTAAEASGYWLSAGPAYELIGQSMIRFKAPLAAGATIDIEFVPTGEVSLHKATGTEGIFKFSDGTTDIDVPTVPATYGALDFSIQQSVITLSATPDGGTFDRRLNAYVGSILRIYNGPIYAGQPIFPIREFLVTAYNAETLRATVRPNWPIGFSTTGSYSYELVPVFGKEFLHLVILRTAAFLLGMESPDRVKVVMAEYKRLQRSMLTRWSNADLLLGRFWNRENSPYATGTFSPYGA